MQIENKLSAIGAADPIFTASARTWEAPKVVAMEDIDSTEAGPVGVTDAGIFS